MYMNELYTIIIFDKYIANTGPGVQKSARWINEWLFMNDRMKKENARAYGSPRAYRRTFMAWKTCQSLLEASAENLSSDIPIHRSAMLASSYILHSVVFAQNLLTINGTISIFFDCQITFVFTYSIVLPKLNSE